MKWGWDFFSIHDCVDPAMLNHRSYFFCRTDVSLRHLPYPLSVCHEIAHTLAVKISLFLSHSHYICESTGVDRAHLFCKIRIIRKIWNNYLGKSKKTWRTHTCATAFCDVLNIKKKWRKNRNGHIISIYASDLVAWSCAWIRNTTHGRNRMLDIKKLQYWIHR